MYRILLVDDELDALQYFGRMFRENLDKQYEADVYAVDSAEKAMEYFREYKVDLVVSDIQMPGINGLEMYQQIKASWPKSRFLFLTGFMDFDYVYSTAAQDSHTRFLTKLEPAEKIIDTVKEMFEELEESYREKELLQKAAAQSREAYPLLQNRCLGQYLFGKGNREQIRSGFEKYGISLDPEVPLSLIGAVIEGGDSGMEDQEHLEFVLKTVMNAEFQKDYQMYGYLSDEEDLTYTWLLQEKDQEARKIQDLLEYVQTIFRKNTGYLVSFSYGTTKGDLLENPRLYKKIRNALGYRNKELTENISPCDLEEQAGSVVWENEELIRSRNQMVQIDELEHYLELGQEKLFFELFQRMVAHMGEVQSMNYTLAQEIYYKIAVLLLRYINLWRLNEALAFRIELYKLMRADMHENWSAGVAFLRKTAEEIFALHFEAEKSSLSGYIQYVRNYIKEHMEEDLSLVLLSEKIHLNASYLSRLFKKETGEKLYDYILRIRMQKAAELVMEGTMKIQDIAQTVGYESVQSFNRAFKKYTGEAPVNYRKEVKKGEEM